MRTIEIHGKTYRLVSFLSEDGTETENHEEAIGAVVHNDEEGYRAYRFPPNSINKETQH